MFTGMKSGWAVLVVAVIMVLIPASPLDRGVYGGNDGDEREIADGHPVAFDFSTNDGFTPENISLDDDAFHADMPLHTETWYFECMSGNFSIVFITTVLSQDGNRGAAMAGLYIYRDGHMEVMERMPSFSFSASDKMPLVQISGSTVIRGFMEGGHMIYNVSFEANGRGISLQFVNDTEGWQGAAGMGWWLAVPGFHVSGIMKIDGKQIIVDGTGYHDHNVFSLSTPAAERGYMDGKILRGRFSIVWGYLMHNILDADSFVILSEDGSYTAVSPDSTEMKFSSYTYDMGWIPTEVFISINDSKNGIFANLHITTLDFHHIRLPFLRYWRYHVRVEGEVITPSHREKIDETDIMERMIY